MRNRMIFADVIGAWFKCFSQENRNTVSCFRSVLSDKNNFGGDFRMNNDFSAMMAQRTDAELLGILTRKSGDYQPEAVAAAKKEFERRNFSIERIEEANRTLDQSESERAIKESVPLEMKWKLRAFFVPRCTNFLIAKTFKAEGHLKKHDEAVRWTMYGFAFYAGLVGIVLLLNRLG